jgi:hypothetical protein
MLEQYRRYEITSVFSDAIEKQVLEEKTASTSTSHTYTAGN